MLNMLKLKADPTFNANVPIPVPGQAEPVKVGFTFKHRTREQLSKFLEGSADTADLDYVMGVCEGWELTDKFDRKNINLLLENYACAAQAIAQTYVEELVGVASLKRAARAAETEAVR